MVDKKKVPLIYKDIIFHIPHSSTFIPNDIRSDILLSDEKLLVELGLMTDWYTDELFDHAVSYLGKSIKFPVSRLVVDPERFADDETESMSEVGMGVIYIKTSSGKPLRDLSKITSDSRTQLLNRFYYPHHDSLTGAVSSQLDEEGRVLIIDCHSFPDEPLPYERCQSQDRPEICIGTDPYHTPEELISNLKSSFESLGYKVAMNSPFAGSIVPSIYYQKNKNVHSIMIEINRNLYMDNLTIERGKNFATVRNDIYCALRYSLASSMFG
jgi:N-formylglutamate deformylase